MGQSGGLGQFGVGERGAEFGMSVGVPGGPEAGAEADLGAGEGVGEPLGDGLPATGDVAGHEEVSDDEGGGGVVGGHPDEVVGDGGPGLGGRGDGGEAPGAIGVAELEVGEPDIEQAGEERSGLFGEHGVGLEHQGHVVGQCGDQFEQGDDVEGGFAAEDHDGAGAALDGEAGEAGGFAGVDGGAGGGVPARLAGDAEIAAEVAAGEGDGEGRDQFQFIGHVGLGGETAGGGSGVAEAGGVGAAVGGAAVEAEVAGREGVLGEGDPFAGEAGAGRKEVGAPGGEEERRGWGLDGCGVAGHGQSSRRPMRGRCAA